jgi:hypothetical protein
MLPDNKNLSIAKQKKNNEAFAILGFFFSLHSEHLVILSLFLVLKIHFDILTIVV